MTYGTINTGYRSNYYSNYRNLKRNSINTFANQVSERGNSCTDGKDDGKIGGTAVVGNILQGAGKQLVNMVKGAFCDENGFSITRTLGTVAIGALCCACPAVGLGLAAVGFVAGGSKLVSSTVKALNSKTDAEAKDNWEKVGEGGLTVGVSVIGAKASYGAIKARGTELSSLSENASFSEWGKALAKDAKSTTTEGLGNIWNGIKNEAGSIKDYSKAKAEYNQYAKDLKAGKTYKDYDLEYNFEEAKNNFSENSITGKAVKKVGDGLNTAKTSAKSTVEKIGKNTQNAKASAGNTIKNPAQAVQNLKSSASTLLESAKNTVSNLKNVKLQNMTSQVASKYGSKGVEILNAIKNTSANINELSSQYGYENVMGVLSVVGSYRALDCSV